MSSPVKRLLSSFLNPVILRVLHFWCVILFVLFPFQKVYFLLNIEKWQGFQLNVKIRHLLATCIKAFITAMLQACGKTDGRS